MIVDVKALIQHLKRPTDRERISLYVSGSVYEDFKKKCEANRVSPSELVEYIMLQFNESHEAGSVSGKKKRS